MNHNLLISLNTFSGGLIGLALIVYAIFAFDGRTPFPSLYALAPTVETVLIVLFARPGTFAHAVLSLKPLVGVGLISYSLYLWHQPIFAFYRHYNDFILPPAAALYLIVVAFVLAFISYRFVERPFRDKVKFSGRSVFAISGIVGAILLVSGGAVQLRFQDYKNFWLAHQSSEVRSLVAILEEADPQLSNFGMKEDMSQILSDCRFNVTKLDAGTQYQQKIRAQRRWQTKIKPRNRETLTHTPCQTFCHTSLPT